jgi:LuxR family transcriptional regulator, maltose regulon positive regulatory protein
MNGTATGRTDTGPDLGEQFPFTKFLQPVIDERVVAEHVVAGLDDAMSSRPVTLMVAPAGSGKTTALAAWASSSPGDVVWVRVGPEDAEPSVFAAALLAGGRHHLGPTFGNRLAQLLAYSGAAPSSQQMVTSLVNDLGDHGPATLILDDVHEVVGADAEALIDELLDHLPPDVRVVIGSRVAPAISAARRRVRGQVAELGLDDLLLDRDAVARVLAREAPVTDGQVDAVMAASGGWAAAIRLATAHVGLDDADVSVADPVGVDLAGMQPDLATFLAQEVLDGLPDDLRVFLLETSVLDELTPSACDAVTERSDSLHVLAELDRRNLFLTRHRGTSGDTWRTHDLFTAFLRDQRDTSSQQADIQELHRRAARVLPPFQAVPHLLASGDHAAAAEVIVELAFADLEINTVVRLIPVIRALPPEVREGNHRLAMLSMWQDHVAGKAHDVVSVLDPLWNRLVSTGQHTAAAEVGLMLAEVQLQLGDIDGTGRVLEHALTHSAEEWRPLLLAAAVWWSYFRNDWKAMSSFLEEAVGLTLASGQPRLHRNIGPSLSPMLLFLDLGPAWLANVVEQLAAVLTEDDHATVTGMRPVRAGAALLRLDVAEAAAELRQCLAESVGYGRMAWKHQEAEVLLMAVCLGFGDLATVQGILNEALPRLDDPVYRQYRHVYVHAAMRMHWLAGEHRQVVATYDRYLAGQPRSGHLEETVVHAVAGAMVARIDGRTDDALELLREGEQAQRAGRCWLVAGMPGLDRASVLLEQGRAAAAIEAALPALDEAARVGPGILFPDARAHTAVLERCAAAGVHADLIRAVLAVARPSDGAREAVAIPGTGEVLSPRELEVLTEVATGASNREIAGALFISEPTVKSHLTRILRKLEATSRTHAVSRARELRLL